VENSRRFTRAHIIIIIIIIMQPNNNDNNWQMTGIVESRELASSKTNYDKRRRAIVVFEVIN